MPKSKELIIFFGRFEAERILAGEARLLNITTAFERAYGELGREGRFVRIGGVDNLRGFVKYLWAHRALLWTILDPRVRVRIVAFYFLKPPLLWALRVVSELSYYDFDDDPGRLLREYGMREVVPGEAVALDKLREVNLRSFRTIMFLGEEWVRAYPEVPAERTLIVPYAIDLTRFTYTGPAKEMVIGIVGGTATGRGTLEFLDACRIAKRELPQLRVRLALNDIEGRGNLAEVRRAIRDHDWISLVEVDYSGVPEFLSGLRVGVIPYRMTPLMDIAMPMKLFDYLAVGLPVLATKLHQITAILEETGAGITSGFSPEEMAEGIVALCKLPRADLEAMGRRGRRAVEEHYSQERVVEILRYHLASEPLHDQPGSQVNRPSGRDN
jgi:glycosyltransferase involved in cell wall biosynthesis